MTERGKKIALKMCNDSKLADLVKNVKTREELVKVLNKNGIECCVEDFANEKAVAKNGKVSLDEAKAVAGGVTCACVVGGGGTSTCYCVVGGGGGPNGAQDGDCVCAIGGGGSW